MKNLSSSKLIGKNEITKVHSIIARRKQELLEKQIKMDKQADDGMPEPEHMEFWYEGYQSALNDLENDLGT